MSRVHSSFAAFIEKHSNIFGHLQVSASLATQPSKAVFWQRPISVEEVLISSVVLILLCGALVASLAHYPYYPCCFHQMSAAIRNWNFQGLDPSQPKEFWGFSYLSALLAAVTRLPDIYAIVVVSSASFVIANYLCCVLWDTKVAAWLMVVNYWWIDTATEGLTEPLFMALLLSSFVAFRREQSAIAAVLASAASIVRPAGIFALIAIGSVLLARRELRRAAMATAIGLAIGVLYIIPMILIYGDPFANVAGYHKSDWSSRLPLTAPLSAIIKGAAMEPAFGKREIFIGAWVIFSVAGVIRMATCRRFRGYAKIYPVEALFATAYAVLLFSYDVPQWSWKHFPRFVIPLLPFLLLFAFDRLPLDRRILWGVALANVGISVWPKVFPPNL